MKKKLNKYFLISGDLFFLKVKIKQIKKKQQKHDPRTKGVSQYNIVIVIDW